MIIKKVSAIPQAKGEAKAVATYPKDGTNKKAVIVLADISKTPAKILGIKNKGDFYYGKINWRTALHNQRLHNKQTKPGG